MFYLISPDMISTAKIFAIFLCDMGTPVHSSILLIWAVQICEQLPMFIILRFFEKLFGLMSHTLTRLVIDLVNSVDMGDFICDLFTTCPNLTHLRCTPATESMSRVIDLHLSLPQMDTPQLKRILSFFIGVRHFYLQEPFDADQILGWIDATLPLLYAIRLGKDSLSYQPAKCGHKALSFHQDCAKQERAVSILKKYTPVMSDFLIQTDLGMEPVYNMIPRFIVKANPISVRWLPKVDAS
ncbi:hypothetical protein BJV82DRAFT_669809 [Fennellomyces sp. T-0311]|nr:hypothetical protein BJV82DRAFT_669809 [Fennellomyces sp. T-0311]